ncbi:MAG: hypothetical protein U0414_08495 [Polyangiaceae bacterium]
MPVALTRRAFGAAALASLVGCARARAAASPTSTPAEEQDAAERARAIVDAKVGALFYVPRIRGRPGVGRIAKFAHWARAAERLGIDAIEDVDRAFACAGYSSSEDSVLLLEHSLDPAAALVALQRAAGGALAPTAPAAFPSTSVKIQDRPMELGLPRPGLFALVPSWAAPMLAELADVGGLPHPRGDEAARFYAFQPALTLDTPPEWPPTIGASQAEITFDDEGGAHVLFQATSTSPEQAKIDAAAMEKTLDDLLHIDLTIIRIPIFDPIHFSADGSVVRMSAYLLASDVDWLLGFGA